MTMKSVLFVCLGNICRSPMAEGVFKKLVSESGYTHEIDIDSAGTSDWHTGLPPDSRAISAALNRGINISALKAKQISANDFAHYNYIIAMDKQNQLNLLELANHENANGDNIKLFMRSAYPYGEIEIPDPFFGDEQGFDKALDMIENASQGLLAAILQEHD